LPKHAERDAMLPSFPACTIYSVTLETVTDIDVGLKQPISLDQ